MKLKNPILKLINLFHKDPCEEDLCVVRAGCSIKQKDPFFRRPHCPTYNKYMKREDKIRQILNDISDWFWIIILCGGGLSILITFLFGMWKWYEIMKGLFK
jgi:hypothetical protein